MQMGVVRHKSKEGAKSTDMAFLHGHVHIPGEGGGTLNRSFLLQTRNFTKSNSHRLLYPTHPSVFLKEFHSLLARQQIDG